MAQSNNSELNEVYNKAAKTREEIGPITEVVIQGTPFCNYRCKYCYLSEESRANNVKMSENVAADTIKFIIDSGYANKHMVLRWHAGEPLAAGLEFYKNSVDNINKILPVNYSVTHTLQTNASYINNAWCDFFKEYNFIVGVSIDGPKFIHDKHRVFKNGSGTFDHTMKGIKVLQRNNIEFDTISVITEDALEYPEELYEFFCSLGTKYFAFNVEEFEGSRSQVSFDFDQYMKKYMYFFGKLYELQKDNRLKIREVKERTEAILFASQDIVSVTNKPFFMFNVDYKGSFTTFCPELLGVDSDEYGEFVFGNIYKDTIDEVLLSKKFRKIHHDINLGVNKCKQECQFFSLCGGGAPGNKLSENGSFNSTETFYCKTRFKVPISIIVNDLEGEN